MVYESDFYTTRRPYSRPLVSSYSVTTPPAVIPLSTLIQLRSGGVVPHLPYVAHKRLVTVIHTPVHNVYYAGTIMPVRIHARVRPSVIAAELNRIRDLPRPSTESYTEKYLNSKDNIYFDDEAREIRARVDSLLRRVHVYVPRATPSDFAEEIVPERMRSNDYVRRLISGKSNTKKEAEPVSWYEVPERGNFGNLACVKYVAGKPQSIRKPYYKVADLRPSDIKNDVNFLSYYSKNRLAAANASPDQPKTERELRKARALEIERTEAAPKKVVEPTPAPKQESKLADAAETKSEAKPVNKPEPIVESAKVVEQIKEPPKEPEPVPEPVPEPEPKRKVKPTKQARNVSESPKEVKAVPERKPEPKPTSKPVEEPKPEAKSEPESKPEPKAEPKAEPKTESKPEPKSESRPEPKAESEPEPKPEPKLEATEKSAQEEESTEKLAQEAESTEKPALGPESGSEPTLASAQEPEAAPVPAQEPEATSAPVQESEPALEATNITESESVEDTPKAETEPALESQSEKTETVGEAETEKSTEDVRQEKLEAARRMQEYLAKVEEESRTEEEKRRLKEEERVRLELEEIKIWEAVQIDHDRKVHLEEILDQEKAAVERKLEEDKLEEEHRESVRLIEMEKQFQEAKVTTLLEEQERMLVEQHTEEIRQRQEREERLAEITRNELGPTPDIDCSREDMITGEVTDQEMEEKPYELITDDDTRIEEENVAEEDAVEEIPEDPFVEEPDGADARPEAGAAILTTTVVEASPKIEEVASGGEDAFEWDDAEA